MSSNETLGARLRNLLSPYKNLIAMQALHSTTMQKNDLECTERMIKDYEKNLQELIDFSNSDEMEHNFVK